MEPDQATEEPVEADQTIQIEDRFLIASLEGQVADLIRQKTALEALCNQQREQLSRKDQELQHFSGTIDAMAERLAQLEGLVQKGGHLRGKQGKEGKSAQGQAPDGSSAGDGRKAKVQPKARRSR